jgi:hypothetical protein
MRGDNPLLRAGLGRPQSPIGPLAIASTSAWPRARRSVLRMPARGRPTDDDRRRAIDIALGGLARGDELADLADGLEPSHPGHNTFPGGVLLDLVADATEI